jgi:L-ascorbate metabolism protein UlaG (beta-lactamase superfamily)
MEKLGDMLGTVCGVIFIHPSEKTLYLAGDTVWNHHVENSLETYTPEVVILNSGDAQVVGLGSIIMGKRDVLKVHEAAPNATLIATHMEAVNHAVLSRKELREFSIENGFDTNIAVPEDGETVVI